MSKDSPCCYCNNNATCVDLVWKADKTVIFDPLSVKDTPKVSWCPCYPYFKCPSQGFNDQPLLWGTCYCDDDDSICLEIQTANGFHIRPPIRS